MGACMAGHCNELDAGMDFCVDRLSGFETSIDGVETAYVDRFALTDDSIRVCSNAIQNALAQDSVYRHNFTVSDYSTSETFATLYSSTVALKQNANYRQMEYQQAIEINANREKAIQAEKERIRLEEERKKREKQAGFFKAVVGTFCTVMEVGVTVLTMETGTTAAKTIFGAVQGFTNYVLDDIYVDQKDFNIIDCGKQVVGGAVKNYVGSYIGDTFGVLSAGTTNLIGKAAWGGIGNVVSGGADRFLSGCLEGDDYGTILKNTFDLKEIGKDVVGGAVKDSTKDWVSGKVDILTQFVPHNDGQYDFGKIINKGVTNSIEGMATRTVDAVIDERAIEAEEILWNDGKLLTDFVSGASKEVGKEGVAYGKIGTNTSSEVKSILNTESGTRVADGVKQVDNVKTHESAKAVSDKISKKQNFARQYPKWLGG